MTTQFAFGARDVLPILHILPLEFFSGSKGNKQAWEILTNDTHSSKQPIAGFRPPLPSTHT
jgi:hypothetical protein